MLVSLLVVTNQIRNKVNNVKKPVTTLGCMLDEVFVDILVNFDADKLWGKLGI